MGKVMTSGGVGAARALAFLAAFAFPIGSAARAEGGAWAESAHAKVRLVSALPATRAAQQVPLGLEIVLAPGWKTYWRSPGEGGLPPRFDWAGSVNLAKIDVDWPAPKRFEVGGIESIGYAERVILPLAATLARPGEPLALRLALQYAVCREICMLVDARLSLDLPSQAPPGSDNSTEAEAIARFQARVPRPGAELGWSVAAVGRKEIGEGAGRREVVVIDFAAAGAPFAAPELLIERTGVRFGMPVKKAAPAPGQVRFAAPVQPPGGAAAADSDLVLTLIDGERAGTFRVPAPAR
jgi:suppressor for copper-sensitivity B